MVMAGKKLNRFKNTLNKGHSHCWSWHCFSVGALEEELILNDDYEDQVKKHHQ